MDIILTDIPATWSLPAAGCWRRMRWTAGFTWQETFSKAQQSKALVQPDTERAQTSVLVKEDLAGSRAET